MTKEDEIWYAIQDIVRKHTKQIWSTPYNSKPIIPSDEIYELKQDLFKYAVSLTKGNAKD